MMFTDKPLRLISEILGVETIDDRQIASSIPKGTVVQMVHEPTHDSVSKVDFGGIHGFSQYSRWIWSVAPK